MTAKSTEAIGMTRTVTTTRAPSGIKRLLRDYSLTMSKEGTESVLKQQKFKRRISN